MKRILQSTPRKYLLYLRDGQINFVLLSALFVCMYYLAYLGFLDPKLEILIAAPVILSCYFIGYLKYKKSINNKMKFVCYDLGSLSTSEEYEKVAKEFQDAGQHDLASVVEIAANGIKKRERELLSLKEKESYLKEEALKSNDIKTQFIANITHELRSPMHSILSFSKISLKKIDTLNRIELAKNIQLVYESGTKMLMLIDDLLDFTKLDAGEMKFVMDKNNILDIVNNVVREFQSMLVDKNLTFSLNNKTTSAILDCDSFRIEQVMRNLISNAIKFTPQNGKVDIIISNHTEKKLHGIKLAVQDNGAGIPENALEEIFEKFVRHADIKITGTGLGLSICKQIIEAHQGQIIARNLPDGGASIEFFIPYSQTQSPFQPIVINEVENDDRTKLRTGS